MSDQKIGSRTWRRWALYSLGAVISWPMRALSWNPRPARYQQLYVRTSDLASAGQLVQPPPKLKGIRDYLGEVVTPGDWDLQSVERGITQKKKALLGLVAGLGPKRSGYLDWMEAGIALTGSSHGCTDSAAAMRRSHELQSMIEQIRRDRRLKERSELDRWAFRERGGVKVHIGRDGTVYRWSNEHRSVFAEALCIEAIPVAVTAIHPEAVSNGAFRRLLEESDALREAMLQKSPLTQS